MILQIKPILKEKGISQVKLAKMLSLSKIGLNLIVNNKTSPSINTLERIAIALNVSIGDLLGEKERPQTFSAIINDNGVAYEVRTKEDLKSIVANF